MGKTKDFLSGVLRWSAYILLSVVLLFALLVITIRIPSVQTWITHKLTKVVTERTGAQFEIERLYLTYSGGLDIEGLYVGAPEGDTIVYINQLKTGVSVAPLFNGRYQISHLQLNDVNVHLVRAEDSLFNFDFIIRAFTNSETTQDQNSLDAPAKESKKAPALSSGLIQLSNCRFTYLDSVSGIELKTLVDKADVLPYDIDLNAFRFSVKHIMLDGSSTSFRQFKSVNSSNDSLTTPLPEVAWDHIEVLNSSFDYKSSPDNQYLTANVKAAELSESLLELKDSALHLGNIQLSGINFNFTQPESEKSPVSSSESDETLSLPYWKIDLAGLNIQDANLQVNLAQPGQKDVFDPLNLSLTNLNLLLEESSYQPEAMALKLADLSSIINESFDINTLSFNAVVNEEHLGISRLELLTKESTLHSNLDISYAGILDFISHPDQFNNVNISFKPSAIIELKEVLYFLPGLDTINAFKSLANHPLIIAGQINGSLDQLQMDELKIQGLSATKLRASGSIMGLPDLNQLKLNLPNMEVKTSSEDLSLFIDTTGIVLPDHLQLQATLIGSTENAQTQFSLKTDLGDLIADITLKDLMTVPVYKGEVKLIGLNISKLAGVENINPISSTIIFDGSGKELSNLALKLDLNFDSLEVNGYDFHTILFNADIENQYISLNLENVNDELLFHSQLEGYLDTLASDLKLNFDLKGADLQKLGFTQSRLKTSFQLQSHFKGSIQNFDFNTAINQILIVGNGHSYRADSVFASLNTQPDSTDLNLYSSIIRADMHSNCSINELLIQLQHATGFLDTTENLMARSFKLNASAEINNNALLSDILLPNLQEMDTIKFKSDFRPEQRKLFADLSIPQLRYANRELQNLELHLNTDADSAALSLVFDKLIGKWVNMNKTELRLERYLNSGSGHLVVKNASDSVDYNLRAHFEQDQQTTSMHLEEDSLILNSDLWHIQPDNLISWKTDGYSISNFDLEHEDQHLELASGPTGKEIDVVFKDFDLNILFGLLNNDQDLVAGQLDGTFKAVNVVHTPGFTADLKLNDLRLMGQEIGQMSLDANNIESEDFEMKLLLNGPEIDFKISGRYNTNPDKEILSMTAKLERLGIPLIEALLPSILDSTKGNLQANLTLEGSLRQPSYRGNVAFQEVGFIPKQIGGYFSVDNSNISLDNEDWVINRFELFDGLGNKAVLSGDIKTENPLNPAFDLNLKATNFQLLNAIEGSNALYYGTVRADIDIQVNGDLSLPVIKSRVVLRDETDFTYIVPESTAKLENRNGIVVFEDFQDTSKFMTVDKSDQTKTVTGFDLDSRIILKNGTRLRMILDPRSGDNLSIKGAADLQYLLSPNGNMSLTGNYTLNDGGYKLNLFDLVKKNFDIKPGSTILWSGNPMGASLNITAIYESRTSAASLMNDPDPRFNRVLPFQVLLFIKGTLDQPEISFAIDMPEDNRGALAGDVYAKIREVNQNESELNKQVFGLIVFDRFIPSSESGDAGVSTADIALSSVSGFVSSQLNNLSGKYLPGVELDVNIGSYTDYGMGAGQQRTDLNVTMKKAFFDDRFILELGSNVALQGYQASNQIMGDVALEYKLTEDGRYRLRGYRRNDVENVIEGQVIITGLGLIFTREFNNWEELLAKPASADTTNTQNLIKPDE